MLLIPGNMALYDSKDHRREQDLQIGKWAHENSGEYNYITEETDVIYDLEGWNLVISCALRAINFHEK